MRMRIALDGWNARLVAALSLAPLTGCSSSVDDDGGAGSLRPCTDSTPYTPGGVASGFEECAEGYLHRPEAVTCASVLPRPDMCAESTEEGSQCAFDADCTEKPHGSCSSGGGGFQAPGCYCSYGCVEDSDCGEGQICLCNALAGYCVNSTCGTDGDCPGDALCAPYVTEPGCGGTAYACQTPQDECSTDEDCEPSQQCTLEDGHRVCADITCAIGRPFLIDGSARVAPVACRSDFADVELCPALEGLSPIERAALATRWTEIGLMEHASIAAFARFSLQLLSLGAPPDLLTATQAAMADETAHARIAFGLASAYAGRPIGPGPLSLAGSLDDVDGQSIVEGVIAEGCIGETIAALEAAEAAERASDPIVRSLLRRIADDEMRHAELAWRFVDWTLASDPALAPVARRAFEQAMVTPSSDAEPEPTEARGPVSEERLLELGCAGEAARRTIRRQVLGELVGPLAERVLARRNAKGGANACTPTATRCTAAVDV